MFLLVVLFWDAYWTVFLKEEKKITVQVTFREKKTNKKKQKKQKQSFRNFQKKRQFTVHGYVTKSRLTKKKTVPLYNNDIN